MSEFKSVDAWAVVCGGGVCLDFEQDAFKVFKKAEYAEDERQNEESVIPVTISPHAEWVKVSERLPEELLNAFVIGRMKDGSHYCGTLEKLDYDEPEYVYYWITGNGSRGYRLDWEFTHIMPLTIPEPPKGDANLTSRPNSISEEG